MTEAADLVARLEAIDQQARAEMLGPLTALKALPDPQPPAQPPVSGVRRPDLVDRDRKIPAQTINKNGTVIENALLTGRQVIAARDVVISNCVGEITGAPPTQHDTGLILCTSSNTEGAWLEYLDLRPLTPHPWWEAGIYGRNFTAVSVRTRGTVDGFALVAGADGWVRVRTVDTLSEDHAWFASDPNHSDGSHADGYQIHSPAGARVKGVELVRPVVRLPANGTSGVMCNVPAGVEQLTITRGEFHGGRSGVNFYKTPGSAAVTHNLFTTTNAIFAATGLVLRSEGNVRPDGTAANTPSKP